MNDVHSGEGLDDDPMMLTLAMGCCMRTTITLQPGTDGSNSTDIDAGSNNAETGSYGIGTSIAGIVAPWAIKNKVGCLENIARVGLCDKRRRAVDA